MAHSILLNVSKDNEVHDVLVCAKEFRLLAAHLNRLPFPETAHSIATPQSPGGSVVTTSSSCPNVHEAPVIKLETNASDTTEMALEHATTVRRSFYTETTGTFGSYTDDHKSFLSDSEGNVHSANREPPEPEDTSVTDMLLQDSYSLPSVPSLVICESSASERGSQGTLSPPRQPQPDSGAEKKVPPISLTGKAIASAPKKPRSKPNKLEAVKKAPPTTRGGKVRGLFRNLLDKGKLIMRRKGAAKAPPASKKIGTPVPRPGKVPIKPPITMPVNTTRAARDEKFMEMRMQCRCAGLFLWINEVELELKWTRLDVRDCNDIYQQPSAKFDPQRDVDLELLYRRKDSTEPLKLTLRLASPLQRCVIFHAMLFNKYRGSFYSIDQGEQDLQRGLFSEVKEAYAKICKHVARRRTEG